MVGRMFLTAIFISGAIAIASGQSIQLDPSELNGTENPARETKLVSMPPLPSDEQQQFESSVKDVHFDFDKSDLRPEDRTTLQQNAEWLKAHPQVIFTLEGDADDRGSIFYNLVLSAERANAVKDVLVEMGVRSDQIAFATGWGKLYPTCSESDESCWSQNRRTHFATWPPAEQEATNVASADLR
jgi:peptidoglycan-associated lipoprotein